MLREVSAPPKKECGAILTMSEWQNSKLSGSNVRKKQSNQNLGLANPAVKTAKKSGRIEDPLMTPKRKKTSNVSPYTPMISKSDLPSLQDFNAAFKRLGTTKKLSLKRRQEKEQ